MKALVILALFLSGCASNGVQMTDAEVLTCRNVGCAAFTEQELLQAMGHAYKEGYESGWKDAAKQSGRAI